MQSRPAATMGFFILRLKKNVLLHPKWFGPSLSDVVETKLRQEVRCFWALLRFRAAEPFFLRIQVEGTCTQRHGYIIMVNGVVNKNNVSRCFSFQAPQSRTQISSRDRQIGPPEALCRRGCVAAGGDHSADDGTREVRCRVRVHSFQAVQGRGRGRDRHERREGAAGAVSSVTRRYTPSVEQHLKPLKRPARPRNADGFLRGGRAHAAVRLQLRELPR